VTRAAHAVVVPSLVSSERETYEAIWSLDAYAKHSPGETYLPVFLDLVGADRGTLLDAGCGTGRASVTLQQAGFDVVLADLTDEGLCEVARSLPFHEACLWRDLSLVARGFGHPGRTRLDYAYCCDVLEHIPPQFTMLVIDQLLRVTSRGVFLSVSLVPDHFGVWLGKPLHQTVQPFTWWRDGIASLGELVDARDLLGNATFYVRRG
jgi:SAM-dependent methyltransferase